MDAESRALLTRARDALMRTDIAKPDLSAQLEWAETVHTIDAALARPDAPAASDEELARVAYDAGDWFDCNARVDSPHSTWERERCAHIARAVHAHVLALVAPVIEACAAFMVARDEIRASDECYLSRSMRQGAAIVALEAAIDAARKKGVL